MDESLVREYPALEAGHFWFVTRREFVRSLIGEHVEEIPKIIDVGCGSGVLAKELVTAGADVTGVDVVSHPDWEDVGGSFHEGDYLEMAPGLGEFDCVLALDVIEHVEEESAFASSLRDNVRPGGAAIVTVPAYQWLWSGHDEINHHYRRYTSSRLIETLSAAGLTVTRCGYIFMGLVGPKLGAKALERYRKSDSVAVPSEPLNMAATGYFRWEHAVAKRRRNFLPAGTSVVAVCKREL
jgi:2-polyprenyl-3-methyl-5-hydroxy-6-metoxy-1,4-benzoquinol methylase